MNVSRSIRHPLFLTLAVFFIAPVVVMPLGGLSLAIEVMIWIILLEMLISMTIRLY